MRCKWAASMLWPVTTWDKILNWYRLSRRQYAPFGFVGPFTFSTWFQSMWFSYMFLSGPYVYSMIWYLCTDWDDRFRASERHLSCFLSWGPERLPSHFLNIRHERESSLDLPPFSPPTHLEHHDIPWRALVGSNGSPWTWWCSVSPRKSLPYPQERWLVSEVWLLL